ncbi:ankyrin repeat domain-containing protein [Mangrovivirga sp. M17]|uniref:Ankyrin repeat domain-containing protein n=1 Tax=Mangrovivirga halotolerans TaxID=2993936 RepID=A0ABT3RMG6_9BACT|nr:ankyrin repeat domain-containing protein [Mangrovivirga halotolerans]MCX2742375.1 ankyrin repeat domain-containing protein [Mangrovivirga halotolerans]
MDKFFKAVYDGDVEIVKSCLEKGIDLNKTNDTGKTALHISAENNNKELIEMLIKKGSNPNILNKQGYTPAQSATLRNNYEALNALLKGGAEIAKTDPNGNTLLANAVMHYRGDDRIIKLLLEKGIDPKIENNHGISLFNLLNMPKNKDIKHLFE